MSDGPHDDHQHSRPHTPPMAAAFLEFDLTRTCLTTLRRLKSARFSSRSRGLDKPLDRQREAHFGLGGRPTAWSSLPQRLAGVVHDRRLAGMMGEASAFAQRESAHWEQTIWGVQAIGTYVEAKFQEYLKARYTFELGSAAKGIDFPGLNVDLKVTSVDQPQSSCPFRSARQKIYGLGYAVLIFVYEKSDNETTRTGRLGFKHTIFVEPYRTADYQTTTGFRTILENNGNQTI